MYPEYRWRERGHGESVVLLHGLMGQMDHWERSVQALGEVCRAIALELPIFHPALPEASIAELSSYVHRFLDALAIPRAVVGGNSLGGHIALALALTHPERVSGLILTGSSGLFERGFTRGVPHRPSSEYVREKMEEIFFDPTLVTPVWVEEVRRVVTTPPSAMRVLRFAQAAKRHTLEERLPHIRMPTLLVWGAQDRITPPEVAERFHALIPDSRLVFLANCGHVPMLEQPTAFSVAARAWLEETSRRRARWEATAGALP
ncbi:MAG: alpha/beta fold hydrolase [candidate division NC10 bacterium]|nr:alpha/beta fold hydrolase [candidate division NC10 bacterium]